jgi:lipoprotein-anchoring transpeptidase ErfK/SrfK
MSVRHNPKLPANPGNARLKKLARYLPVSACLLGLAAGCGLPASSREEPRMSGIQDSPGYRQNQRAQERLSREIAHARGLQPLPTRGPRWTWTPENAPNPNAPVTVLISLADQKLRVQQGGHVIGETDISTGKPGQETPTGEFTILEKKPEHYSNLYGQFVTLDTGESVGVGRRGMTPPEGTRFRGSPMPWMQRLTHDGICLHAGRVLGYPASSGCIRLPDEFAPVLFKATQLGTTVRVVRRF